MPNKYTRQPNKANSQKASQAVIKSWQCEECGFGWRKSKPIKCSWSREIADESIILSDALIKELEKKV